MKLKAFTFLATNIFWQVYAVNDSPQWSWSSCNHAGDTVRIDTITISPSPPRAGNKEIITVSGFSSVTLQNGAWAEIALGMSNWGPFPLPGRPEICSEISNMHCPINSGHFDIIGSIDIPSDVKGNYIVKVDVYNADSTHLACVNIQAAL